MKKLIEEIQILENSIQNDEVHLKDILDKLALAGTPILFMILSLPFVFPIPIPGLSILFGLLIAVFGIGMLLGKKVHLPKLITNKKISAIQIKKILNLTIKFLNRIEPFRISKLDLFFTNFKWPEFIAIIFIIISALLLMLPLPPGTNFPPAFTIVILAMGLIQRNFLILFLGYFIFTLKFFLISYFSKSLINLL